MTSLCLLALFFFTDAERFAGAKATAGASEGIAQTDTRPSNKEAKPLEYGSEAELKGLARVYIHTNDMEARKLLVKELEKEKRLVVVGKIEEAQFVIAYMASSQTNGATFTPFGSVRANNIQLGEVAAITRSEPDNDGLRTVRVLWSSRKAQQWAGGLTLSRHPATNAAREFLKVWQRENKN